MVLQDLVFLQFHMWEAMMVLTELIFHNFNARKV